MSRRIWWAIVPIVTLVILVGAGSLLANKDAPEAVAPAVGEAYFPAETLSDGQGAVTVEVTQLNLNGPGDTLDFEVAMNTHSVNLDLDLTKNAFLKTNTGVEVSPVSWNAPAGGHHISGTLSFASTFDGKPLLQAATSLTLTIRNVDVPARVFTWDLQPAG